MRGLACIAWTVDTRVYVRKLAQSGGAKTFWLIRIITDMKKRPSKQLSPCFERQVA